MAHITLPLQRQTNRSSKSSSFLLSDSPLEYTTTVSFTKVLYSVTASLGIPAQQFNLIIDTGSVVILK